MQYFHFPSGHSRSCEGFLGLPFWVTHKYQCTKSDFCNAAFSSLSIEFMDLEQDNYLGLETTNISGTVIQNIRLIAFLPALWAVKYHKHFLFPKLSSNWIQTQQSIFAGTWTLSITSEPYSMDSAHLYSGANHVSLAIIRIWPPLW